MQQNYNWIPASAFVGFNGLQTTTPPPGFQAGEGILVLVADDEDPSKRVVVEGAITGDGYAVVYDLDGSGYYGHAARIAKMPAPQLCVCCGGWFESAATGLPALGQVIAIWEGVYAGNPDIVVFCGLDDTKGWILVEQFAGPARYIPCGGAPAYWQPEIQISLDWGIRHDYCPPPVGAILAESEEDDGAPEGVRYWRCANPVFPTGTHLSRRDAARLRALGVTPAYPDYAAIRGAQA